VFVFCAVGAYVFGDVFCVVEVFFLGEGGDDLGGFGFFDACVGEGGGYLVGGFHVVGEVFAEFLEVDFCGVSHGLVVFLWWVWLKVGLGSVVSSLPHLLIVLSVWCGLG